jgi:hypothetical protein
LAQRAIENPTLLERFVSVIPLPYPLAALIWALVLSSGFLFDAISYLTTGTTLLSLANLPNRFLNFLLPFYLFLMVRYMRLRVVALEAPIAARLTGGEHDYRQAFGRMTQTAPVVVLTATLGTLLLLSYVSTGILPTSTAPLLIVANIIVVYLAALGFTTYLWEFATASLGLHKLGGSSLRLGSFLEDRMMGAKPMGNLGLTLTTAYFGGLLLVFLLFTTFQAPSIPSVPGTAVFYAFLLLGVALFFLPLNSIHAKMQAEKRRLMREIGVRYSHINETTPPTTEKATLDDVRAGVARLTDLRQLEILDRKVTALPTWPFDIQLVSRFITIVLSVTAVLLSRLITSFLKI